jgi:uncharacterized membrane protein
MMLLLLLRIVHVLVGVFWAGTIMFVSLLLMPSVRDAGPDGGKVMLALMRRGYMTLIPIAALLTIVSGLWLYWNNITLAGPAWAGSMAARVYGAGAVAALVAFAIGMSVIRSNALKLRVSMEALQNTPEGPARAALMADMAAPRAKMAAAAPWVAGLLAIATTCMAVARYL